jgi:hypothetical protein
MPIHDLAAAHASNGGATVAAACIIGIAVAIYGLCSRRSKFGQRIFALAAMAYLGFYLIHT